VAYPAIWERVRAAKFDAEQPYLAAEEVIDTYSGPLCTVGAVVPPGIPPEAKVVYEHMYPLGKTYVGKAEQCTAKVTVPLPDQLFPNTWEVNRINSAFEDKIKEQGGEILHVKILEDTTPTLTTDYYVVATIKAAPAALVTFPFPWAVVIVLVLAILLLVAFTWLIIEVKTIDWGKPVAAVGMALGIAAIIGAGALLLMAVGAKKKGGEKGGLTKD